jgi:hypothetical protein
MRKIIVMMSVSLDGFIEGPNRELDGHVVDDELHSYFNDVLGDMGAFLHGRVMYELMAGVWPEADKDPASTGPMVEFARIWLDMPKIVYSKTLEEAGWNSTGAGRRSGGGNGAQGTAGRGFGARRDPSCAASCSAPASRRRSRGRSRPGRRSDPRARRAA